VPDCCHARRLAQVVVICGRNRKLLADLQTKAGNWPGGSHVVPCGFVDNIHEVGPGAHGWGRC
jgi:hypothetical protein